MRRNNGSTHGSAAIKLASIAGSAASFFRATSRVAPIRCALLAGGLAAALSAPAQALPIFSHEYGVPCQKCHTAIPSLNAFGTAFLNNGYHIFGGSGAGVFPISVKENFLYTSAPASGLPKAIVDEMEILTAGTVGPRGNYFVEQYAVDGGEHGNLREAWFDERLTSGAAVPVDLRVGQFTMPLPIDPESFRESYNDYALFVQTVGNNPFDFFHTKPGMSARIGNYDRGLTFEFSALEGHDVQSGLPTVGIDLMQTVHELIGPFDMSVYRYSGQRDVDPGFTGPDPAGNYDLFTRTGAGFRYAAGRWTSESVLQENTDTNVDGFGRALHSSGGFTQLRYAITRKLFGLVRYDGTHDIAVTSDGDNDDSGFLRSTTALVGYRLSHNTRITIEDVITHYPRNTLNTQFTIGN